jgi:hypothetical protein
MYTIKTPYGEFDSKYLEISNQIINKKIKKLSDRIPLDWKILHGITLEGRIKYNC